MTTAADLNDLRLDSNGFSLRGSHYPFSDVAHLRFARMDVTTYAVPIKVGTDSSAALLVSLKSGEEIKFVEKPGWFLTSSQTKLEGIVDLYSYVAQSTLKDRLGRYLSHAELHGHFVYAGFKFCLARKSIARDSDEFTVDNTNFIRAYNYVELRPKNYGLMHKLKRELSWSSKIVAIDTLTDTDAILAVFDHFYGLRWS
jgi:hypothetical protein